MNRKITGVAAIAALVWVAAATLHEGLGHGLACTLLGGKPTRWSTFHFNCAHEFLSPTRWRVIAGAGSAVNVALLALGWFWWRRSTVVTTRIGAWTMVVVNGLTTFGYFVFSAAFGIGDWNTNGVLYGVSNIAVARAGLAVVGIIGYIALIRLGAAMLSSLLDNATAKVDARAITTTVWLTLGVVSLLAGLLAGADWRTTIGASLGAAMGGNAGLLTIPRFVTAVPKVRSWEVEGRWPLRTAALLAVAAFVVILGPGVPL